MAKENTDTKAKKGTTAKKTSTNSQAKKATPKAKTSAAKKNTPKVNVTSHENTKAAAYAKEMAELQEELTKVKAEKSKAQKDAELFRLRFNSMLVVIAILVVIIIGIFCWTQVEV